MSTWPSFTVSGERDELELRGSIEQEVRVDRDAMATHPEPRLMDVAVRLAVGRRDDLGDVHPDPVGVPGELVGQGDVDVPIGRVGELREFGRLGR